MNRTRRSMPRTRALIVTAIAILTCSSTSADEQTASTAAVKKPNIVLIMTDDQGYGDLRFHGNELIDTPALDQLAQESTRFERFMVCPLCWMTRAALLSGRYSLRTGCASVTRGVETVRPEEVLIPEVLKTAGYATGCFGKWHIGEQACGRSV